jgi:hypothetical protein
MIVFILGLVANMPYRLQLSHAFCATRSPGFMQCQALRQS